MPRHRTARTTTLTTTLTATLALTLLAAGSASAAPVTLSKLTGLTGGAPAETAVYKAALGGLGLTDILSITIRDNSSGLGGATGQFSGFDLDAIRLSTTDCADAACAAAAPDLGLFDFVGGLLFAPGTQRPPVDLQLFGTGPGGATVDNGVARLGAFDGNSTTAIPGADGFLSMGDDGILSFNLTAAFDPTGVFLYIGEVGDNGEVAAGSITVSDTPANVPEPAVLLLFGMGLLVLAHRSRRPIAIAHAQTTGGRPSAARRP